MGDMKNINVILIFKRKTANYIFTCRNEYPKWNVQRFAKRQIYRDRKRERKRERHEISGCLGLASDHKWAQGICLG